MCKLVADIAVNKTLLHLRTKSDWADVRKTDKSYSRPVYTISFLPYPGSVKLIGH